jgi:hypothetical protein
VLRSLIYIYIRIHTHTHTQTHTHTCVCIYTHVGSPLHISPHLLSAMTSSGAERLAGGGRGGVVDLKMDGRVALVRLRVYVCMYVCMYIHITSAHTIYYVLAAVFASCFYFLFKFRFVREAAQGGTLVTSFPPLK